MNKFLFFFFFFLCFNGLAQSKKELLAQIQQYQQQQARWKSDSLRMHWEIDTMNKEIATMVNQLEILESENQELKEDMAECQVASRRNIEVYDLYSFGYQPLRNSDKEFEGQIRQTQKAIEAARWKNIEDLMLCLKSPKRTEIEKQTIFSGLLTFYPALAGLTMPDFIAFSAETQNKIKLAISQQTQKELKGIVNENIWIQSLDGRWNPMDLVLLQKYWKI